MVSTELTSWESKVRNTVIGTILSDTVIQNFASVPLSIGMYTKAEQAETNYEIPEVHRRTELNLATISATTDLIIK